MLSSHAFAPRFALALSITALGGALAIACAHADVEIVPANADPGEPQPSLTDGTQPPGSCTGMKCNVPTCEGGATTTIEGDVYDPAGKVKLYGAIVYVPNREIEPMKKGVSCERCGSVSGAPIASALTDEKGHFVLKDVPAGEKVPLVVQIGKWRRKIELPKVEACKPNTVNDGDVHLPRSSAEGDIPQMAVVTGGFDELGCLLSRIGVDGAEYTSPGSSGRIHVYRGVGGGGTSTGAAPPATDLWNDVDALSKYDAVLLACEGWEYDENDGDRGNKTVAAKEAMHEYTARGGRVFATHYHYTWFKESPDNDFRGVATWNDPSSAYGTRTYDVDTSFPKGAAFAKWLENAGGTTPTGGLLVTNPGSNVAAVNPATTQRWLYTSSPANVGYFSFNTPVDAKPEAQCGRAVFSDVHVSGEQGSRALPSACGSAKLTPQELALEFMLFDLASCIQPDSEAPKAPR